jgi:hypothetical protein
VFSSSEARLTTAHAEQGCAAATCSVPSPQQQQKLLLAVAWVTEDTICVGCSDGSIQVVKVGKRGDTLELAKHPADYTSNNHASVAPVPVFNHVTMPQV